MAISNLTTGLRPGVCTSLTRPTAPYEGQVIYETDTDLSYVWGGSAWQQVSGGTAVGNSGLVYVKSQTVGSTTASITIDNAFSATYDNYKIIYTGGVASTTVQIRLQLSGLTANYYGSFAGTNWSTSAYYGQNDNNGPLFTWVGYGGGAATMLHAGIFGPFSTNRKYITASQTYVFAGSAYGTYVGECALTTSTSSFILSTNTGTLSGGVVIVYGYRKA